MHYLSMINKLMLYSYFVGLYFTQDYTYRDVDGHYQIQGRKGDIVRIKGVWLQVPEIECAIVNKFQMKFLILHLPVNESFIY